MDIYKLVVVPEQSRLREEVVAALESFVASGGHVLISGAHLSRDWPDLVGADPNGELIETPPAGGWGVTQLAVAERTVSLCGSWQAVTPRPGTEIWGYRLIEQEPEKDITDQAIITRRVVGSGSVVAIHGPIFQNYFQGHYPPLRRAIGELMNRLGIEWDVDVKGPAWLEVILRRKHGQLMVNLLNRGAGEMLSPNRVMVEELPPVQDVTVQARLEHEPSTVTIEPGSYSPEWSYIDGKLTVHLAEIPIHDVLVVA